MHIGVHQSGIELQEKHIGAVAIVMQHVVVGLAHGVRQHLVAHEAAIDKEILSVARAAGIGRLRRQAVQAQAGAAHIDRQRGGGEFFTEHGPDTFVHASAWQMPLRAAVVGQDEVHVRPR